MRVQSQSRMLRLQTCPLTELNILLGSQRGFEELERGLPQSDGCLLGFEVLVFRLTKHSAYVSTQDKKTYTLRHTSLDPSSIIFFPVARSCLVTLSIGLGVETPYCSMFQPPISPKEFAVATLARVTSRTNVRCLPPPQPPLPWQLPLTRRWPPAARPKPLKPPRQSLLRRRGHSLSQCLAVRPWWIYCDRLSPFFVVTSTWDLGEDATMCSSRL